ncbi:MAG: 3-hydroxyacyl-CoA dehydrogenase NAD-binding domain-containing protein [Longimicrobiales bacterium]
MEPTPPKARSPQLVVDESGVAHIIFDDPDRRLNVLSRAVMERLGDLLGELENGVSSGSVRAVLVRSGKSTGFIAGADVDEVRQVTSQDAGAEAARVGQALFGRLAALPVPTVAAIDGVCLGGGTELALACDFRIASDSSRTKLGLPEVQLGILPGWGGTSRLPRLVGLQAALDLILTGKNARASKAKRIGLVDEVFPKEQFLDRALSFAVAASDYRRRKRKAGLLAKALDGTGPGRALVLRTASKKVLGQTSGHYPAPLKILDVIKEGLGRSLNENLALEATALGELVATAESKNLLHLFGLRERARKGPWTQSGTASEVKHLAVLGAGVMGGGIAQLAAFNGTPVRMKDIRHEAVASGLAHAKSLFDQAVKRRKLTRREAAARMALVSGGLDYSGFACTDLVVEAVVERMDIKKSVLSETEKVVGETAILTSNTSSLSIEEMGGVLDRPGRFAGMHFFNPVHRMPLVEVVRSSSTTDDVVETIAAFAVAAGKVPVVTKDGPGFLVNRILGPYLNEAGHLLAEGFDAQAIDRIWKRFGMPMGPYRLIDEVGIDVMSHAGEVLHEALGDRLRPASTLQSLAASGRLGKKGGLGFYRYEGGKQGDFDDGVYQAMGVPLSRTPPEPDVVTDRLVLTMINEAARILDEGIVASAADVDLGMIMGTGFPPFRGGLLKYSDDLGAATVADSLGELAATVGPRFDPSPVLARMVSDGARFYTTFPGDL